MPIYEYGCPKCFKETSLFTHKVPDSVSGIAPLCSDCGAVTESLVSLPGASNFGFKPFSTCDVSGEMEYIGSRQRKRELMAQHRIEEAG